MAKIALLSENYYPTLGGIQEHIHHLALYLMGQGHQVRVITGSPHVPRWCGPTDKDWVLRVGKSCRYSVMGTSTTLTLGPRVAWKLREILRKERFDLVHVHGPCDFGLPMLLYPQYSGALVATLHSPINNPSPLRKLAAPYYRWVLGHMDKIVSVSQAARAAMGCYARFESDIVPNGVDARALGRGTPMARFRDGSTNILMLGRLEPRNGPDIVFEALQPLLKTRPNIRLIVAGEGRNGTREHELMVPREVRHRVVFLGSVYEERADVYASADLCVVPARSGTFSIIVLEALAAGVPIVTTPFVKGYERERHFEPVTVCRDFSPQTMAVTIDGALGADQTARVRAGKKIASEFDWSLVGRRVERIYREALATRAGRQAGVNYTPITRMRRHVPSPSP